MDSRTERTPSKIRLTSSHELRLEESSWALYSREVFVRWLNEPEGLFVNSAIEAARTNPLRPRDAYPERDLTPEHTKRNNAHDSEAPIHPDVSAAYAYVTSVLDTFDIDASGAPAWHGWALREAFLAGVSHRQLYGEFERAWAGPRVTSEFDNELGNRIRITIEGPTSRSENVLTPSEGDQLRAALNEHAAARPTVGTRMKCRLLGHAWVDRGRRGPAAAMVTSCRRCGRLYP